MSMREVKDDLIAIVNAVTNVLQGCNENLITPAQALNELPPKVEQTRSESYSKGHEQGFEAGYQSGAESGNEAAYNAGVAYGRDAQYSEFWDAFQDNGNRPSYLYGFSGHGWTDDTFKPKHNMTPTRAGSMFAYSRIIDLRGALERQGVTLDTSQATSLGSFLQECSVQIAPTISTVSCNAPSNLCAHSASLRIVEKVILKDDGSQTLNNAFLNCYVLTEIRFEGVIGTNIAFSQSYLLSNESVQSIIDALKDLTGATAQKVSFHTDVLSKLTDGQALAITSKNWTIE